MGESIGQRLTRFLIKIGVTQTELGIKLGGKSRASVNNWCKGTHPIPDDIILEIIRISPELNARWFITGIGEMFDPLFRNVYSRTSEIKMDLANEPTSPIKYNCGDPVCLMEKENLLHDIKRLEKHISDLTRKEGGCQGETKGGVEKTGKAG